MHLLHQIMQVPYNASPYFSQNTFTRNKPPAPNNVQYSQGAHWFRVLMVFFLVVTMI